MWVSRVKPIRQPNDYTCGPAALKHALAILGITRSLSYLAKICQTNGHNGTSTKHMIRAVNKLGLSVLVHEGTTLAHVRGALRFKPSKPRAVMVSYLYYKDADGVAHPESGHWATVASYKPSVARIVLLDSYAGTRTSYRWQEFRTRWIDFDLKRRAVSNGETSFRLIRHWQRQLMLVIAPKRQFLPLYKNPKAKLYVPKD